MLMQLHYISNTIELEILKYNEYRVLKKNYKAFVLMPQMKFLCLLTLICTVDFIIYEKLFSVTKQYLNLCLYLFVKETKYDDK